MPVLGRRVDVGEDSWIRNRNLHTALEISSHYAPGSLRKVLFQELWKEGPVEDHRVPPAPRVGGGDDRWTSPGERVRKSQHGPGEEEGVVRRAEKGTGGVLGKCGDSGLEGGDGARCGIGIPNDHPPPGLGFCRYGPSGIGHHHEDGARPSLPEGIEDPLEEAPPAGIQKRFAGPHAGGGTRGCDDCR